MLSIAGSSMGWKHLAIEICNYHRSFHWIWPHWYSLCGAAMDPWGQRHDQSSNPTSTFRLDGVHLRVFPQHDTVHCEAPLAIPAFSATKAEERQYSYYVPFYFQAVQSVSATTSGIRYIAFAIPEVVAIIISGATVSRIGHYVSFLCKLPETYMKRIL